MNKRIAVLTLVYILLMSPFCFLLLTENLQTVSAQEPEVTIPNQDHMIVECIADPDSVDPAWTYDTASIELISNVYETLIAFDTESVENFVPELATEWTISPDGLTYTFTIREGVLFQDGSIMATEDVEYSFEHILVQDRSGGPAWMFYEPLFGRYHASMAWPEDDTCPINLAVESNATHVWFNLYMAYPPFMQILSQSWASILNKDFCIAHGDWPGTFNNWKSYHDPATAPLDVAGHVMCGTGPYMLDCWIPGVEWSVVKFDDYWQGWPAPSCSRDLDKATVKVVYDWGTRLADFRAGTADMVYVPRAYIDQVEGWPGIRFIKDLPTLSVDAAFLNFAVDPTSPYIGSGALDGNGIPPEFFSDKHIRRAFAYAFDHTKFIEEVFLNEAETPPGPHIKGLAYATAVWYGIYNPIYGPLDPVPSYEFDMAKVAEELKLAYYGSSGSPGPVWTNGFKMTIAYNAGNVPRMTAALMFKETLESLNSNPTFGGCTIDTVAVTWSTYLGEILYYPTFRSVLPLYIMGWSADYPDAHNFVMPFQHSEGELAYPSSYSNATVDALIEAGIAETDPNEREYIYWQIAWSYYHDVPGVCLAQPLGRHWERDWVQGWYYNIARGGSLAATSGCASTSGLYFYHLWKGLDGDINGDNSVNFMDVAKASAHWSSPAGPLGYNRIADVWPELQYRGDLAPSAWLPQDEFGVPLLSIGEVDVFDWAAINQHMSWDPPPPMSPGMTTLAIAPPETVQPSGTFYIDITVDDVENMWAYQIKVVYDTNVLTATDFGSWYPFATPLIAEINDPEGYVKMVFIHTISEHAGLTTSDPVYIGWIEFSIDGPGASPIQLVDSSIGDVYGEWIPHVAMCGEFRTTAGLPMAKFTFAPEHPVEGEEVTFTSESTDPGTSIVDWDWDFGDDSTGTGPVVTHTYTDPGEYTVTLTVTNDDTNTDSHSDTITVDPGLPSAKFTWTPKAPFTNEPMAFTSLSTDPNGIIVAWDWDFGDGNTGTGEEVTHTYPESGYYRVTLTVTDNDGNIDSHYDTITIRERPELVRTEKLIATVETWNLPQGTENGLTSKLEDAIRLLNMGNENGAIHKLMDLMDRAEAMRGKKLTDGQADYIISESQRIINLI